MIKEKDSPFLMRSKRFHFFFLFDFFFFSFPIKTYKDNRSYNERSLNFEFFLTFIVRSLYLRTFAKKKISRRYDKSFMGTIFIPVESVCVHVSFFLALLSFLFFFFLLLLFLFCFYWKRLIFRTFNEQMAL